MWSVVHFPLTYWTTYNAMVTFLAPISHLRQDLNQDDHIGQIFAIPGVEWFQQLQSVAFRIYHNIALEVGRLVEILARIESFSRETFAFRLLQLELRALKPKYQSHKI